MHTQFMLAALEQAHLGRGACAPNPCVGAVAVHNHMIIAQGWHLGAGMPHAEQHVLEALSQKAQDITLYITLEPCNHWGRTPPCVEAIIRHGGISKVVYAYSDPNPVVAANNSPARLLAAGIDVLHHPLQVIDDFYQSYEYWTRTKRPWVTAKLAHSLDGKIAGKEGRPYPISNADCAEFTHRCRMQADIILTSAQTILQDNPRLNVRLPTKEQAKPIAILDRELKLSAEAQVFRFAKHCHIFHAEEHKVKHAFANCTYHAVPSHEGHLDLACVFQCLGQIGYHDVWVEAGGRLFAALHQAKMVQRTYLYIVPRVLGEEAWSGLKDEALFKEKKQVSWMIKGDNIIACFDWQEDTREP